MPLLDTRFATLVSASLLPFASVTHGAGLPLDEEIDWSLISISHPTDQLDQLPQRLREIAVRDGGRALRAMQRGLACTWPKLLYSSFEVRTSSTVESEAAKAARWPQQLHWCHSLSCNSR